jgi:hypothetical protein
MADIFRPDAPPEGFKRTGPGWIQRKSTPNNKIIGNLQRSHQDLRQENEDLKARLEQLEQLVAELPAPKKTRKQTQKPASE